MQYNITKLNNTHLISVLGLLKKVFTTTTLTKAVLKWKYSTQFKSVQYGAFIDTKIVAHYANIILKISKRKQSFPIGLCVDIATLASYRRQGIVKNLALETYKKIKNMGILLSIGFSNISGIKMDRFSNKYGYKEIGQFKTYYFFVYRRLTCDITMKEVKENINFDFSNITDFYQIQKDVTYVNWRYQSHPSRKYKVYLLEKNDSPIAYIVLVESQFIVHIVDIVCIDQNINMKDILNNIFDLVVSYLPKLVALTVLDNRFWILTVKKLQRKYLQKHVDIFLTLKFHIKPNRNISNILDKNKWICFVGDVL